MSNTFRPIKDEPNLKCQVCNYHPANIYLTENHTAYPNCGDQTCVSGFYMKHQMALAELEKQIYADYIPSADEARGTHVF